ncbi:MAG: two-component sensor histidine kinase [Prevotellaceae bacterium]|jgi:signal transduction histidine kinase|nr:two-component sensor histidine kinase [Prevotellaceae bacterium]
MNFQKINNQSLRRSRSLSFNKRLFFYFFSLFFVFSLIVLIFQYNREKSFRIQTLNVLLKSKNELVYNYIKENKENIRQLDQLVRIFPQKDIRLTVIDLSGKVIYDNDVQDVSSMDSHLKRPEIQSAIRTGSGYDIRLSGSTNREYYYFAEKYDTCFVRTALPYDVNVISMLKTDTTFLYFMFLVFVIVGIIVLHISNSIGKMVAQLRDFALKVENNEPIDTNIRFPDDELGEISKYTILTYRKLRQANEALAQEKEKLIMHLQTSQEGLAIFSPEKKEILANSHFIRYINIISDKRLNSSDEVFDVPEFKPVVHHISTRLEQKVIEYSKPEKWSLHKNGKTFTVQCVIFHDKSFEISIVNVTQQEREKELKRQLTQNISHELKTPVSSIQGYLETLIDNPDITEEKRRFFIERSYTQAQRLTLLLQDISLLNKMDDSSRLFTKELLNVGIIIHNVLDDISLQLEEKNISLQLQVDKNIKIEGNQSLIYSIFRNLIDNTITYAGENISVHISCYREDEEFYYFSFYDTGMGVSESHLNRLFERFYRVDEGRSRKIGGTGLGLAIVKNAVQAHHGKITAKCHAGGGLEFLFSLRKK